MPHEGTALHVRKQIHHHHHKRLEFACLKLETCHYDVFAVLPSVEACAFSLCSEGGDKNCIMMYTDWHLTPCSLKVSIL